MKLTENFELINSGFGEFILSNKPLTQASLFRQINNFFTKENKSEIGFYFEYTYEQIDQILEFTKTNKVIDLLNDNQKQELVLALNAYKNNIVFDEMLGGNLKGIKKQIISESKAKKMGNVINQTYDEDLVFQSVWEYAEVDFVVQTAKNFAKQIAGENAEQYAGDNVSQTCTTGVQNAGDNAYQTIYLGGEQTAKNFAYQTLSSMSGGGYMTAGNNSTQKTTSDYCTLECGDYCNQTAQSNHRIISGNDCNIYVENDNDIITKDNTNIELMNNNNVWVGDNCSIKGGINNTFYINEKHNFKSIISSNYTIVILDDNGTEISRTLKN